MAENKKPFQSINDASASTGLSRFFLRNGCRNGSVPHVKSGEKFFINVPLLLQQLGVPDSAVEVSADDGN